MEFTCPQGELYRAKKGAGNIWIIDHMTHDWQYFGNLRLKHKNPSDAEFLTAIEKHAARQAEKARQEAWQAKADFFDDQLRGGV